MNPTRVVVTDDHPLFRKGIVSVLDRDPEIEVVGEAGDGSQAVQIVESLQPDVVILDLMLPVLDGCDAIAAMSKLGIRTQFLILTAFEDDEAMFRALDSGARGYLLKESEPAEVIKAVKTINRGESHIDSRVAGKLLDEYSRLTRSRDTGPGLSPRELEVLLELANGKSNQQIAEHLRISLSTVKTHMAHILKKLNVSNRHDAIKIARSQGVIRA